MKRRTKIVCTLGPATGTRQKIFALAQAGMNVARLNCSHGDWQTKHQWVQWIREASERYGPIAILVDLQGPKFRLGPLPVEGVKVGTGQLVTIGIDPTAAIPLYRDAVYLAMKPGDKVLLGDGEVQLKLMADLGDMFQARVLAGGLVQGRKGITLSGRSFDVPALTEQDKLDIVQAIQADADFIALSYVKRAEDIALLASEIEAHGSDMRTVAKIETREALHDLEAIIHESDAIMVARGDLGLQMDIEDVPAAQKNIINACFHAGKPVITATQMLESMLHAARPTRAEASDVFNAILDGTDAVMLSGETAAGSYPLESVRVMDQLSRKAEKLMAFEGRLWQAKTADKVDNETDAVGRAAVQLAGQLKVKAIVTTSTSGTTPRLISRYRPKAPIYCACWNRKTRNFCSLVWGVEAADMVNPTTSEEAIVAAIEAFKDQGKLKDGDKVVLTCGVPPGIPGSTNLILVETLGGDPPL